MKKKNYITPNLIIVSIATDSLVLAGSGGDTQSVNNCQYITIREMASSLVNTAALLLMMMTIMIMIWNGTGNGRFYLRIIGYLSH